MERRSSRSRLELMSIKETYQITRQRTEEICKPLTIEDYIPQPVPFVSPAKWHIAHTTWFFEEMILKQYVPNYKEFHPDFGFLFNSYYNTIGDRIFRADRGNITRPGVDEVFNYRKHVDAHMAELLSTNEEVALHALTILGINHEQQHQELMLTDLKFTLGHNPISPVYSSTSNLVNGVNSESGFLQIDEGVYSIGFEGDGFNFDNELGLHKVYAHEFQISKALVTNAEYIEFIEAEGYTSFQYWLDEGWSWVNANKVSSPLYWHKIKGVWHQYTLAGLQPVQLDAILSHVSFYEANAFAAWKGMRLPTEFEWEIASDKLTWGQRWEWTNSAYLPYPNFKIDEGAAGEYNGKFMVNQMVLRGGSVATAEGHSRKTYRNFFHAHYQWQFSGIRLVK